MHMLDQVCQYEDCTLFVNMDNTWTETHDWLIYDSAFPQIFDCIKGDKVRSWFLMFVIRNNVEHLCNSNLLLYSVYMYK